MSAPCARLSASLLGRWARLSHGRSGLALSGVRSMGSGPQPELRSHEETAEWVKEQQEGTKARWRSYGYDSVDRQNDLDTRQIFLFSVSIIFVSTIFWFWYAPDPRMKNWLTREAFLLLREREAKGLPPVDKNFVDPAKLDLPSEEELQGKNLII